METADTSPLTAFLLHNKLSVSLFLISFLLLICGLIGYMSFQKPHTDEVSFSIQDQATSSAVLGTQIEKPKTRIVDVAGAVMRPGVYELDADARIKDAIATAGGLSEKADSKQIASKLNLATKLTDGMKVYIPVLGEEAPIAIQAAETGNGLININSASASELDTLSGVGKVTAEKIISNRPYQVIEELVAKKVVSEKVLSQIKEKIVAE